MRILVPALLFTGLAAAQAPRLDLKVLYAGVKDHPRTAQWREFLGGHGATVTFAEVEKLADGDGKDADVVILDCPDPIVRSATGNVERIAVPVPKGVTVAFDRPVVVIAGMAIHTDRLHLKSDWL